MGSLPCCSSWCPTTHPRVYSDIQCLKNGRRDYIVRKDKLGQTYCPVNRYFVQEGSEKGGAVVTLRESIIEGGTYQGNRNSCVPRGSGS